MRRKLRNLRRLVEIFVLFLAGCASPKVPATELAAVTRASVCKLAIDGHIERATSCPEAQMAIDAEPACAEFGHLDLACPEWRRK